MWFTIVYWSSKEKKGNLAFKFLFNLSTKNFYLYLYDLLGAYDATQHLLFGYFGSHITNEFLYTYHSIIYLNVCVNKTRNCDIIVTI